MKNRSIKYTIVIGASLAVLYPLWEGSRGLNWADSSNLLTNLFPLFGILAICLLWLHSISGVFEPWLRKNFNFDRFVNITTILIFISFTLHPLLLLIKVKFSFSTIFLYNDLNYVLLGMVGFVLLITYDIGKLLQKREFFTKHWNKILIISNIGFLLIFPHSLSLGRDLESGPLKTLWIFYAISATISIIYTYFISPVTKNRGIIS